MGEIGFMMKAMQRQPVEGRMYVAGLVEEAWKNVMHSFSPQRSAERDYLEKY